MLAYRFVQYVKAVIARWVTLMLGCIGSALLQVPGWIKPYLTLERQNELEDFLTTASTIAQTWTVPLLLFTVFIATFLAWREEREAREKAEQFSPEDLRNELRAVQSELAQRNAREWQPLSEEQKTTLGTLLSKSEIFPLAERKIIVTFFTNSPDAHRLAMTFCSIFRAAGWDIDSSPHFDISPDMPQGIHIVCSSDPLRNTITKALQKSLGPTYEIIQENGETSHSLFQTAEIIIGSKISPSL